MAQISLILPAHNERLNLQPLIDEVKDVLQDKDLEIIVVDDQSNDGTARELKRCLVPGLRVVETERRLGLGRSIGLGIKQAVGDLVIVMDSDFNHQPKYLPFMVQSLDIYDAAFASRFYPGGGMDSFWRHHMSRIFNLFTQITLGGQFKDHSYGFFIIRRSVLNKLPFKDIFWGYGDYCVRLIYYLQQETDSILQFPAINGIRRFGEGNLRLVQTFFDYVMAVLRFSKKVRRQSNAQWG